MILFAVKSLFCATTKAAPQRNNRSFTLKKLSVATKMFTISESVLSDKEKKEIRDVLKIVFNFEIRLLFLAARQLLIRSLSVCDNHRNLS